MTTIQAPFTPEQVESLNLWQQNRQPFTCGVCRDRDTEAQVAAIEAAKAAGRPEPQWKSGPQHALVATPDGWVCETCDYTQDWAHDFMATGPHRSLSEILHELADARREARPVTEFGTRMTPGLDGDRMPEITPT